MESGCVPRAPKRLFERKDHRTTSSANPQGGRIEKLTRPNSLYLSCAASNNHPYLSSIHHWIGTHIRFATQNSFDEGVRFRFTQSLIEDPGSKGAEYVSRLVRVADLGITDIVLSKREIDGFEKEFISFIRERLPDIPEEEFRSNRAAPAVIHDYSGKPRPLPIDEESDGTRSWFGLVGFVLRVLEEGDVFLVDEIDSSLHPVLSSTLIRMFKDPVINPKGAQMVFASHDTTLLGTMLENKLLERDEVWFTEKDAHGATSLYSLVEFHPRGDENPERGYLQGRYGAVPHVNFQEIRSLFAELHGAAGELSASAEPGPPPESQYA